MSHLQCSQRKGCRSEVGLMPYPPPYRTFGASLRCPVLTLRSWPAAFIAYLRQAVPRHPAMCVSHTCGGRSLRPHPLHPLAVVFVCDAIDAFDAQKVMKDFSRKLLQCCPANAKVLPATAFNTLSFLFPQRQEGCGEESVRLFDGYDFHINGVLYLRKSANEEPFPQGIC